MTTQRAAPSIGRLITLAYPMQLQANYSVLPRLNELFGDHTFFLDSKGLNIVEPTAEPIGGRTQVARVVNLANWSDANTSDLAAHEPEPTDAIVELETKH
jgi:hypothetical protein